MKRSLHVSAPLLAAAALAISTVGCRKPQMQRCVDEQNRVVPDSFCAAQHPPYHRSGAQCFDAQNLAVADNFCAGRVQGTGSGFVYYPSYRYYYGGGGGFGMGSVVTGGGYNPAPGVSYASPSSTTRGGFGSSHGGDSGSGGHSSGSGGGGE
jgi:hypothetical protein